MSSIEYSKDQWSIQENKFDPGNLGKTEVIMALGNGYLGIRSVSEEKYLGETRNMFVAGTFNKADKNEVTELPNLPDIIEIELVINDKRWTLNDGEIIKYQKRLNIYNGELIREIIWRTEETGTIVFKFKRFVSMEDKHLIVQSIEIHPLDNDLDIKIISGINGQVTNSGAQHFFEGTKRLFNNHILSLSTTTYESNIDIWMKTMHQVLKEGNDITKEVLIQMDRRKIYGLMSYEAKKKESIYINKFSTVYTSRDSELQDHPEEIIHKMMIQKLESYNKKTYEELLALSEKKFENVLWNQEKFSIESENPFDLLAARFAKYHLQIMAPVHDHRMGIPAKGLTGEGYKGHSFWDTEIFIFPYFLYTQPQVAKQLLEYRYLTMNGARKKALDYGYQGAMFPWESAWLDDGEVTPVWGAADIITGKATKIWSGFIEQHITADITFAIYQYYSVTKDDVFMENYGYEMIFEAAIFWASRVELGEDDKYHINDVVGPDEYKEHVDDNAFTNYLVALNFELAINFLETIKTNHKPVYIRLHKQLDLDSKQSVWKERLDNLYLPKPTQQGILPQDRTYLTKKEIDLTKYKNQKHVGGLFKEYNLEQVNEMQISKQADVMLLFYLRENLFSKEIKTKSWEYYEPKTLHDSSLSLSTHAIIASDLGKYELAYDLYTKCCQIDLGQNMKSSDAGIHAASLGGMMQVIYNGFGGIRVLDGVLRVEPHLPKKWKRLEFDFYWQGDQLRFAITKEQLSVENMTRNNTFVEFISQGNKYILGESINVKL